MGYRKDYPSQVMISSFDPWSIHGYTCPASSLLGLQCLIHEVFANRTMSGLAAEWMKLKDDQHTPCIRGMFQDCEASGKKSGKEEGHRDRPHDLLEQNWPCHHLFFPPSLSLSSLFPLPCTPLLGFMIT